LTLSREITRSIGMAPGAFDEVFYLAAAQKVEKHFRALELEPGASKETVRAAYRRLAMEYHPDRVATMAPGFRSFANSKLVEINESFQVLRDEGLA
jgi:curved DNA-binding protein CbpA